MADDRPLVKNTADPKQVKFAGRKVKEARELELEDLRSLLATAPGRRFIWRVLGYCKVFADVFDDSTPTRTAFNAGVQNVGHFVMAEITEADEEAFFKMMRESRATQKRQAAEAEALRTARAEKGESNEPDS